MSQFKKTNAMRILDKAGVPYTYEEYEYDENDLDGHHVAEFLNLPYEEVFKTLVTKGEGKNYYVFYVVIGNVMEVRTLVYNRGDLTKII